MNLGRIKTLAAMIFVFMVLNLPKSYANETGKSQSEHKNIKEKVNLLKRDRFLTRFDSGYIRILYTQKKINLLDYKLE